MISSQSKGSWECIENKLDIPSKNTSFLTSHKGSLITGIALFSLSLLTSGGLLLYFKINTIASWFLVGGGGTLALGDCLLGLYIRHKKKSEKNEEVKEKTPAEEAQISVVSWNVATWRDYFNMCSVKNKMDKGSDFPTAYEEVLGDAPYRGTDEEKKARKNLFQSSFSQFGSQDIICLQESYHFMKEGFNEILPTKYSFYSYESTKKIGNECTVIWNSDKFDIINRAHLDFDPNSPPDTIILLKDKINKTTICVGSAHLRGFNLANEDGEANGGDYQTRYDLATMNAIKADLYVFAGDFNATPEHYKPRFDILRKDGYIADESDIDPTIYDANLKEKDGKTPKPAKLDYIFGKGGHGYSVKVNKTGLILTPLKDLNRPSDHLPVGATIYLEKAKQ